MSKKGIHLTDYYIIQQQILSFQHLSYDVPIVNIVNDYKESRQSIGVNTEHFRFGSYIEQFNNLANDALYTILLTDDSMIAMHYIFDENLFLIKHTLSYLPDYKRDLFDSTEIMNEDANIEIEDLARRLSNYLRVDFDTLGKQEYFHTDVHLHVGLFRDSFRIPLKSYLFPNDFVYLVFKYIYHLDEDLLKSLISPSTKKIKLSESELSRVYMCYGIDKYDY